MGIGVGGDDAAGGEGHQEEDEQEDGVGVLQDDEGGANGLGMVPLVVLVDLGQRGVVRHAGGLRVRGACRVRERNGRRSGRLRGRLEREAKAWHGVGKERLQSFDRTS